LDELSTFKVSNIFQDNNELKLPKLIISSNSADNQFSDLRGVSVLDCSFMSKNEAWIEVKLVLLKHFLPDNHHRLTIILQQVKSIRVKLKEQQHLFNDLFIKVKQEWISSKDYKSLEDLRNCYIEMR
jgi:hypothetical protein